MPLILFPSQSFSPRELDPDFESERLAAHGAGLATALLDHTAVVDGAIARAVARVPSDAGAAIYRGWTGFREFLPLQILGAHPKSAMPLAAEFRIFWLDGEPILSHRYWGDLVAFDTALPFDELRAIATQIPSRFFTMDVAFLADGGWTIVELGDGQVAGLPSQDLAPQFFARLGIASSFTGTS